MLLFKKIHEAENSFTVSRDLGEIAISIQEVSVLTGLSVAAVSDLFKLDYQLECIEGCYHFSKWLGMLDDSTLEELNNAGYTIDCVDGVLYYQQ